MYICIYVYVYMYMYISSLCLEISVISFLKLYCNPTGCDVVKVVCRLFTSEYS